MPGNLAELRPLVFIAVFIGITVLFVGWMVAETPTLFLGVKGGSSPTGEDSTSPLELMAWNDTYILNVTGTFSYTFQVGGWNVCVEKWTSTKSFYMETYDCWWIFNWNFDPFRWFKDGIDVTHDYPWPTPSAERLDVSQLDSDYAEGKGLGYKAKNTRTEFIVSFAFNTSKYDEPSDAYNGNEIHMIFNIDWDNKNTGINALGFIAGLFTFSLPGTPMYINAIIWVMMFPPLAYLSFIIVLKIIGSVFGGG